MCAGKEARDAKRTAEGQRIATGPGRSGHGGRGGGDCLQPYGGRVLAVLGVRNARHLGTGRPGATSSPGGATSRPGGVISLNAISALRSLFNRAYGHTRLVLIFSPT